MKYRNIRNLMMAGIFKLTTVEKTSKITYVTDRIDETRKGIRQENPIN